MLLQTNKLLIMSDFMKDNTIKLLQELRDTMEESVDWSIGKQTSTITGWNLVEAIESIAFEMKRYNDAKGH